MRTLSNRCDSALAVAQDKSTFNTSIPDVQRFKFTAFGRLQKNVEALRWVENKAVRQLILFYEDGLDGALNKMRDSIMKSHAIERAKASLPAPYPALAQAAEGEVVAQPTQTT